MTKKKPYKIKPEKKQRCILYARYSPRPKVNRGGKYIECESIEVQLDRLRHWAKSLDIEIIAEYEDRELSGGSTEERIGLQRAMAHVCRERCILAVYSLSRLARCTVDAIQLSEALRRKGANLSSLNERIDTSNYMGRFFFRMIASLAEMERDQISERTSVAMKHHQRTGRLMTSPASVPFGQKIDVHNPGRTLPDKVELEIIEHVMRMWKIGMGYRPIAAELDRLGYVRRGKSWISGHTTVKSIIDRREENDEEDKQRRVR